MSSLLRTPRAGRARLEDLREPLTPCGPAGEEATPQLCRPAAQDPAEPESLFCTPTKTGRPRLNSGSPSTPATTAAARSREPRAEEAHTHSSSPSWSSSSRDGGEFLPLERADFMQLRGQDATPLGCRQAAAPSARRPTAGGRVYWEGFFVNMSMFCGYATLFGLQHEVKDRCGISDLDVDASRAFGFAVSFLYIFNLIFRLSHNILLSFMGPRKRTFTAMALMVGSMLCIAGPVFWSRNCVFHMRWVVIPYAMGGAAMGTFEANFLCCLTPLGARTKHVSITAIPVGITLVLVGGFFAMGPPLRLEAHCIYVAVAVQVLLCMGLFAARIPNVSHRQCPDACLPGGAGGLPQALAQSRQPSLSPLVPGAEQWRQWLPLVWHLPLASVVDMFVLAAFSPGVTLYIWDQKTVALWEGVSLPTHTFFAMYNVFYMLGGLCGRVLSYRLQARHPLVYATLSVAGAITLLTKVPLLAPLGVFTVLMGDGLIYGSIARRIDEIVPKQFNLIAISFWLFIGDFGSVAGSNLICYIRLWVVGS